MKVFDYDRNAVVEYAHKWAFERNPLYYNFDGVGGDCTNFASQCLFSGCGVMNFTPTFGWFYRSSYNRSPSWTGVEYFAKFLLNNLSGVGNAYGPFAEEVGIDGVEIGDFIQLMRENGDFYHTLTVVGFLSGQPLVCAHTFDAFARPLSSYTFYSVRCLHILGFRK